MKNKQNKSLRASAVQITLAAVAAISLTSSFTEGRSGETLGLKATTMPDQICVAYAYIPNSGSNNVSVIKGSTNTVVATVPVGQYPTGVAVTPQNTHVYVTNGLSNNVSVIETAINTVVATVGVGSTPTGVAVT